MDNPRERETLRGLEIHVEAELVIAEASYPQDAAERPVTEWLVDPTDDERYEVGLRGLLGAVKAVEDAIFLDAEPGQS